MINYDQATRLYHAFGSCTVVHECMTPEGIVKDVNGPEGEMGEGGFGGDVREWADIQFAVNESEVGFYWNDDKSEAVNNAARAKNEKWQADIKTRVLAVVTQIERENKSC